MNILSILSVKILGMVPQAVNLWREPKTEDLSKLTCSENCIKVFTRKEEPFDYIM
jgi:hypothetical protein